MRTETATLAGKAFANRPLVIAVAVMLALEGVVGCSGHDRADGSPAPRLARGIRYLELQCPSAV